uniref:Uncharacterized protein n=1 Tax=Panagrolaimus sp. ES5 TaxID=591445 RepID=A0AC34FK14_9BILA
MEMDLNDDDSDSERLKRSHKHQNYNKNRMYEKPGSQKDTADGDKDIYLGYNVDIDVGCIINEDCAFPYTCQYTVMGRRCIKDLTIEYSQPKYDGIPTIEQLETIFNKTFDLDLPWNQ